MTRSAAGIVEDHPGLRRHKRLEDDLAHNFAGEHHEEKPTQ
jgi:hypothetical protein